MKHMHMNRHICKKMFTTILIYMWYWTDKRPNRRSYKPIIYTHLQERFHVNLLGGVPLGNCFAQGACHERHTIPWLRYYHIGAVIMGEHGAESIHAKLKKLERETTEGLGISWRVCAILLLSRPSTQHHPLLP